MKRLNFKITVNYKTKRWSTYTMLRWYRGIHVFLEKMDIEGLDVMLCHQVTTSLLIGWWKTLGFWTESKNHCNQKEWLVQIFDCPSTSLSNYFLCMKDRLFVDSNIFLLSFFEKSIVKIQNGHVFDLTDHKKDYLSSFLIPNCAFPNNFDSNLPFSEKALKHRRKESIVSH